MNEKYIVPPSAELFSKCKNVKRITLAPETEGCLEFIKSCPAQVSVGHTDADYETASAAFRAGATSLTHTYNVMPGIHHRAPGPIGAGYDSEGVFAELISDGVHIHPSAVRMLTRLYGTDRVILVSDAMRAAGLSDGEYEFGGQTMTVKNSIATTETGNLASISAECIISSLRTP